MPNGGRELIAGGRMAAPSLRVVDAIETRGDGVGCHGPRKEPVASMLAARSVRLGIDYGCR